MRVADRAPDLLRRGRDHRLRRARARGLLAVVGDAARGRRRRPSADRPSRKQLDQERAPATVAAELLHERAQRLRRAAGGEQVVVDEDPRPAATASVWISRRRCRIRAAYSARTVSCGSLPACARGRSRRRAPGERRSEEEAAGLGADDDVDVRRASSARPVTAASRPFGSARTGVMSLNPMPGLGKSGISRMRLLREPTALIRRSSAGPGSAAGA